MNKVDGGPTFEEFVATRGRDLWRSAWLLTGDAHKAEDLVQTALMKCWRRWSSIANDGAVEAYVRRAMVTTYTDWWRRKWRSELPTADLPDGIDTAAYAVEDVRTPWRRWRGFPAASGRCWCSGSTTTSPWPRPPRSSGSPRARSRARPLGRWTLCAPPR